MSDRANSCRSGPDDSRLATNQTGDDDADLASLAKAVGHPARVKILRYLASCSSCVCGDIVEEVGLAQSTVSQHLKVLKDVGLVRGEIDPPRVCYCIDPSVLRRFRMLAAGLG